MKIAIVGLGGVGGYIAGHFVRCGLDVVAFARGEHLRAIQERGLRVVEDSDSFEVTLEAKTLESLSDSGEIFDLVLFCVKSYDLQDAYEKISSNIRKETILLSFSNGVDNANRLREMSDSTVLDGCVYVLSHIEESGVIRKRGDVFAAVFGGDAAATATVASLFEKSGLRFKTPSNIIEALWKKYIFIAAFATLTSYYDAPISTIYEEHFDEAKELLEEIAAFAKLQGIELGDEVQKALTTASKLPKSASTSMHKDFTNHKRVELESLSGYVKMPLMMRLYEELKRRV